MSRRSFKEVAEAAARAERAAVIALLDSQVEPIVNNDGRIRQALETGDLVKVQKLRDRAADPIEQLYAIRITALRDQIAQAMHLTEQTGGQ